MNGEKLEGWKLKMIDETRYINWVEREGLKPKQANVTSTQCTNLCFLNPKH